MTTQDMRKLTLTTGDLHTLDCWLAILKAEEPVQGAWIRTADEFKFMVKLRAKIAKTR
jgi:hypothetical protein